MNHETAHNLVADAYRRISKTLPGFRSRPGQQEMVQEITDWLADVSFDKDVSGGAKVCVVQGGTGVGKTVGFLCPTIALARQKKVKLLVSTATVALQEQLINKDLPALAAAMAEPFTFGLLKGRSRYCCLVKLDKLTGAGQGDLLGDDPQPDDSAPQKIITFFKKLHGRLQKRAWSGDKDTLGDGLDDKDWQRIAADRTSCTGSACEQYKSCPYYQAKRHIAKVDVIVANHSLVLSSLQNDAKAIPGGDRAYYVFDEAHHLPSIAINHFAANTDITSRSWIAGLERACNLACGASSYSGDKHWIGQLPDLEERLAAVERLVVDLYGQAVTGSSKKPGPVRVRLAHGVVPDELTDALDEVRKPCSSIATSLDGLVEALKEVRSANEERAPAINNHLTSLGPLTKRLTELLDLCDLMLADKETPPAKWIEMESRKGLLSVSLHACPMVAGGLLNRHLWSKLRGAVATSATLKTLGKFDFFLRESGLQRVARVKCVDVASPFDYQNQGKVVVVHTKASPKAGEQHTAEVAALLPIDLAQVTSGALVLCSSKVQMKSIVDNLPEDIKAGTLVQGSQSREQLLVEHARRVNAGHRSVLVGLQSFGEGLDLPGHLCDWVFVPKIPFAPPNDPVAEARAEWMDSRGRNSFVEMVVPSTGVTLNQWAGRGIRTEDDEATIICYDSRLSTTPYGRQLLHGLPPFRKVRRTGRTEEPIESPAG